MDVFDFKDEDKLEYSSPSKMDTPKCVDNGDYSTAKMASLNGKLLLDFSRLEHQQFLPSEVGPDSTDTTAQMDNELNYALQESKSSDEADDVFTDAYESPKESSPTTSSSVSEDDDDVALEGHKLSPAGSFDFVHLGDRNMVHVCPDYIVYQGRYSTESVLIFSKESMKLEDSTTHGDQGMSRFEWEIADIVDIQSQWSNRLEVAMVKLRFLFKGAGDFSEVEEMQFAVADMNWPVKQDEIMSLDVRYKAVWSVVVDNEAEISGTTGERIWRKSYFPNFSEFSDEIIYPKGDPDAVSISRRDVGLLEPDIFVNDTIIDFYIKFLKNQLPLEDRNRFHFFNSFFFRKLIDLDKDPPTSFQCKAAFQRVRKWTRKVNLFEKDYVFIPVNYGYHWSLIVICHPGEVIKFQDEGIEKSLKVPCILHMDSLKGSHTVLKNIIQSYLWEEWKEKNKDTSDDISPKFLNLHFISLELPQQPNAYDCGLFLLHYVERFLEEAPMNFSPLNITYSSKFLNLDWFQPEEPCLKRTHIQRLISKILKGENPENYAAACGSKPCASDFGVNHNASESNSELDPKGHSFSRSVHGNLSGPQFNEGIEITLLKTSSSQRGVDSSLVLREFMGVETTARPFLDGQYQTFDQAAAFATMENIEDDVEVCEEFVYKHSNPDNGLETDTSKTDHNNFEEFRETSEGGSGYSSEVEVQENKQFENTLKTGERINETRSPLTENPTPPLNQMLDVAEFESCDTILNSHGNSCETLVSGTDERLGSETVSKVSETDGILDLEKIGKAETSEQQRSETVSEFLVSETDGRQDSDRVSKLLVSETDGILGSEMIGKAKTSEQQGPETVLEFLIPETDRKLDGQLVAKRNSDDLSPESGELQPAKRPRMESSSNGDI